MIERLEGETGDRKLDREMEGGKERERGGCS